MSVAPKPQVDKRVTEYLQCKNDFSYYCRNYVLIELPGGDVFLNPYGKQDDLIDYINKNRFVIVLKSRQIGISTIIQAYSSWLMNFYDNVVVGIISKDGKEATDFARAIRGMLEKLPVWMKPSNGKIEDSFDKKTEQSFILSNGSKCYSATVNPKAPNKTLRGKAITFLIIDEGAFIDRLDQAWTAMVPAVATSQKQARLVNIPYGTVILSTPNMTVGVGQWFYDRYTKAMSGTTIFKPFTIHWKQIPELCDDPYWYKNQCEMFDNDPRKIEQELEMKFLSSTGSFFDDKTVLALQDNTKDKVPIDVSKLFNGEMWTFEKPIPGKHYIIGVDTAPEFGSDQSGITVYDYETLDEVWEYQVKCQVTDFVKVVKFAIAQYPGTLVIENNSYGNQVMEEINNSEYSQYMYKEKRGDRLIGGLSVNTKTRPLMIDALYSYVSQYPQMVKSKRLALELIGLTQKPSGKVEGSTGCNDDLALTLAMAMYVRKYDPPLMLETNKAAFNDFESIMGMNYRRKVQFSDSEVNEHDYNDEWTENQRREMDVKIMRHVRDNIFSGDKSFINTLEFYKEK